MLEFLQFMFRSFAIWLGCIILISLVLNTISYIIECTLKAWNVNKHGWPPVEKASSDETSDQGRT